jgi:hypothetical protein
MIKIYMTQDEIETFSKRSSRDEIQGYFLTLEELRECFEAGWMDSANYIGPESENVKNKYLLVDFMRWLGSKGAKQDESDTKT